MPYRRRGSYRGPRAIVTSIKNSSVAQRGLTGTLVADIVAKAVTTPSPTVNSDVSHGCLIKAVYIILDVCGIGGSGVLNVADVYLFKNPGANLVPPAPVAYGTSNEKKFVFKKWRFMIMRVQDGGQSFHWEGWIKIPKRYQRMGTDDLIQIVSQCTTGVTGHFSFEAIYKWYR